jgi:branched-chain amino acid transport system ATP-binding protein
MPLISSISDRLIALDQGRIIATGLPADVLAHPDVVESYLGTDAAARSRSGNNITTTNNNNTTPSGG